MRCSNGGALTATDIAGTVRGAASNPSSVQRLCRQAALEACQRDEGLGVLVRGEDLVELRERDDLDVDALVLLDLGALVDVGDTGREKEVDLLVREARGRVE